MDKEAYTLADSRFTAVITLRSWLSAVGIKFTDSKRPGCDLTVTSSDGTTFDVCVTIGKMAVPSNTLAIRAEELKCTRLSDTHKASTKNPLEIAFSAFHRLTEIAGYGKPIPFNRGQEPDHVLHFEDDGFMVPFRHNEFRRAPNPPAHKYSQYKTILERCAYIFYTNNYYLCERNVTSLPDLQNYARFILVIFCAHYERPNPINNENERLLTAYLAQRFHGLKSLWLRNFSSQLPEDQVLTLMSANSSKIDEDRGQFGEYEHFKAENNEETPDVTTLTTDQALPLISENDEKQEKLELRKRVLAALSLLPHDQMVETLLEIHYNEGSHDSETRTAAEKFLKLHCRRCDDCSGSKIAEEIATIDTDCFME